ncbi:MAG TPA: adenylyltransferase/cytidyltransferase family protein [Candidatus Krumholzibacteria bacterium]|nr:adenylyltransferase/cytidyltransferase family protein [Candidatus Krumholzibacteria bacterium]
MNDAPVSGLIPAGELAAIASAWRAAGRTIVFTNGVFDLLHPGHLALLEECAALGDQVLVAINDDASVARLKGPSRPVYPAPERAEILLALRWVDAVTVFSEDTPQVVIERVRPHVLVKGAEYGAGQIVGEEFVLAQGGRVVRFTMRPGQSTSDIVRRMSGG